MTFLKEAVVFVNFSLVQRSWPAVKLLCRNKQSPDSIAEGRRPVSVPGGVGADAVWKTLSGGACKCLKHTGAFRLFSDLQDMKPYLLS